MATIENLPFSFVGMQDDALVPIPSDCGDIIMPVYTDKDVNFQFILKAADTTEYNALISVNHNINVFYDGTWHQNGSGFWQRVGLGNLEVLFYLPGSTTIMDTVPNNECFRLGILLLSGEPYLYTQECFIKISDVRNTGVIRYRSDVNQSGFNYCDVPLSYVNSIRLPLIDKSFNYEGGTDNIYQFANGRTLMTSVRRHKVYTFQTDWIDRELMDPLQAAIISDFIEIETDYFKGQVVANSTLTVEFNESSPSMRETPRASFTAYETPFDLSNNFCTTCN